jgi:hypothetical protein
LNRRQFDAIIAARYVYIMTLSEVKFAVDSRQQAVSGMD